ncbi:hypothetical protein EYE40_12815 [Glaciihabitans arcticus]|uniref:Alkaline shock response membrane anchor protein AmaP n=1 Tax=Glaciihabitans arcticus TaxID=2668039 RepID=A0A4Q9GTZ8_9MICO|nr:hypothetical protein [Glaciihabitans arcticus]TBN58201.1 hypothetical protein EYE40_12815 [Glaciihabitans arcticus]
MTRSNRGLNRLLLALVGLVFLAAAAFIANRAYPVIAIPELGELDATGLWVVASIGLLVIVLSICWIVTRGGGATRTLATAPDDEGAGSIEARVAADLVAADLERVPDIVDVSARAFRVRGETVLELVVTTRRSADLRLVVDSVGRAVAALDVLLATEIPVLLHVASGVRANLAREQRVH